MEYTDELERMKNRKKARKNNTKRYDDYDDEIEQEIPRQRRRSAPNNYRKKRKQKKKTKSFLLLVFCLLIGLLAFNYLNSKKYDGYWTIAIFGLDGRDGSVGKGSLSDVIIICSIDTKTGDMKLVSVFRDTYMKISRDNSYNKINQAYHRGGAAQGIYALEENLDIKIDDYVSLNWKAVADAINILGGVDLEITQSEFKYINSFITETVETTGVGSVHLAAPGMQHLDGVQAVAYARLRLMDTDYNRTERQRKVIGLAMEKAKKADFAVLNNILVTVFPQVASSIGVNDLLPIAKNIKNYNIAATAGFPFAREATYIGKKDCVVPLTLESNVVQLHEFLFGITDYKVSFTVKNISVQIAKDSGLGEVGKNAPVGLPSNNGSAKPPETTAASPNQTTPAIESSAEVTTEAETTLAETSQPETPEVTKETETEETIIGPGAGIKPTEATTKESDRFVEPIGPGEKPAIEEPIGPGVEPEEVTVVEEP